MLKMLDLNNKYDIFSKCGSIRLIIDYIYSHFMNKSRYNSQYAYSAHAEDVLEFGPCVGFLPQFRNVHIRLIGDIFSKSCCFLSR